MKIAIKKKYIGATATFISLVLGFAFLQDLLFQISQKELSALFTPLIFIIATLYTINYWRDIRSKTKMAKEASMEIAESDPLKANMLENHLWEKSSEEAYIINFIGGKLKFTSSWYKQDEIEKIKSNKYIPEIIKKKSLSKECKTKI